MTMNAKGLGPCIAASFGVAGPRPGYAAQIALVER